jgi:hypothetical protein
MATATKLLIPAARTSESALRRVCGWLRGRRAVLLLQARVLGPALTALGRFLDARERASANRFWV